MISALLNSNFNFFLPPEEVHLWVVPFYPTSKTLTLKKVPLLSSREVLRTLLGYYLRVVPEKVVLQKTARGKLFLPEYPELFFSMAHSARLLVLAFSRHPVGIDLEKKRNVKAVALANKFFSQEEIDFMNAGGGQCVEEKFFELWTAKEAVLKADGRGITAGLREVFATIKNEKIFSLRLEKNLWHAAGWSLNDNSTRTSPEKYTGALALPISMPLIRWHDLTGSVTLGRSCHFRTLI